MELLTRERCVAACEAARDAVLQFDLTPIQLGMGKCPWRVAVASCLMNRTRRAQAAPCLEALLKRWPRPEDLAAASQNQLADTVRGCGFQNRRARILRAFSRAWLGSWTDMRDLPGVGAYVADAVGLFCFNDTALVSRDRVLLKHVAELNSSLLRD